MYVVIRRSDNAFYAGGGRWSGNRPHVFRTVELAERSLDSHVMSTVWERTFDEMSPAPRRPVRYWDTSYQQEMQTYTMWEGLKRREWQKCKQECGGILEALRDEIVIQPITQAVLSENERSIVESGIYFLCTQVDIPEEQKVILRTAVNKLGLSTLEA